MPNKKIILPALSWKILSQLMVAPGWANTPKDVYIAGRMDYTSFFKLPPVPNEKTPQVPLTPEQDKKWCDREIDFEFSVPQVEACGKCLKHFIEQKQVNPGKYAFRLLEAFVGDMEQEVAK